MCPTGELNGRMEKGGDHPLSTLFCPRETKRGPSGEGAKECDLEEIWEERLAALPWGTRGERRGSPGVRT